MVVHNVLTSKKTGMGMMQWLGLKIARILSAM
jgi:hypothetical protein